MLHRLTLRRALDHAPRLAVGDGRALRRPQPHPLLQERVRRRRERRRRGRLAADPRLRLPGRDRLPGRRGQRLGRRAGDDPQRDLPARGGPRRALAAHRVAGRLGRGAALAADGDLQLLGDRQLRLRVLLVPLPGRHDRLRGEADRRALDRRRGARGEAAARHAGRPRAERDGAPALLQHAARPGRRRHRRTPSRRCGRSPTRRGRATRYGNAFRPMRRRLETELEARRRTDSRSARWWEIVNPSVRHRLGEPVGYRLLPGENAVPFAQPDAPVSKRAGLHHRAPVGDAVRAGASATRPATTPTSTPAGPGCRSGRRPTGPSPTGTSWSGIRSATTTCRGRRTGR